jgi:Protein of unknown function (DUF4199)
MLRLIVRYGIIGGLIVAVPLFTITLAAGDLGAPWGYVVGYLTMLVSLSTIFIAIKKHRDADLGGVIRFWPALGLGVAISFIAGIFYVLAWELAVDVTHMDFATGYAQTMIDAAKARGLTGDALAKAIADAEQFKANYANPVYRLPMTFIEIFPVGVLVSLVSAGLLRNSRFLAARRA